MSVTLIAPIGFSTLLFFLSLCAQIMSCSFLWPPACLMSDSSCILDVQYMSEWAVILMSEIIPANRLAHELSMKERWTREKGVTEEGWELAGWEWFARDQPVCPGYLLPGHLSSALWIARNLHWSLPTANRSIFDQGRFSASAPLMTSAMKDCIDLMGCSNNHLFF